MHKPEFDDLCLRYLAGELPAEEGRRFLDHREGCPDCAELMRALETGTRAAALAAVSLPEEAQARIADNVLTSGIVEVGLQEPAPRYKRVWAVGALLAVFAFGAYFASRPAPQPQDLVWTIGATPHSSNPIWVSIYWL